MLSKKEQKFIKSLKIKKYRTHEKRFLVEGTKNVLELLNSDFKTELLVGTKEFQNQYADLLQNIRFEPVKADVLSQLGTFKTNESILALVEMKEEQPVSLNLKDHLFVLDGVGDPGNLGTIIRTLDWFGFKELVCSPDCAEFYHPKVIASTMGSFTRINIHYQELEELFQKLAIPILAADMHGDSLYDTSLEEPCIIVMGSESHGISEATKSYISYYIAIPKIGQAESLNVGVATGIIAGYLRMSR